MPYDVRRECREMDPILCYDELAWLDVWMNLDSTRKALGIDPEVGKFSGCNDTVNQDFRLTGEFYYSTAPLLPELVNNGVRLLVYSGNTDYLCNYIVRAFF